MRLRSLDKLEAQLRDNPHTITDIYSVLFCMTAYYLGVEGASIAPFDGEFDLKFNRQAWLNTFEELGQEGSHVLGPAGYQQHRRFLLECEQQLFGFCEGAVRWWIPEETLKGTCERKMLKCQLTRMLNRVYALMDIVSLFHAFELFLVELTTFYRSGRIDTLLIIRSLVHIHLLVPTHPLSLRCPPFLSVSFDLRFTSKYSLSSFTAVPTFAYSRVGGLISSGRVPRIVRYEATNSRILLPLFLSFAFDTLHRYRCLDLISMNTHHHVLLGPSMTVQDFCLNFENKEAQDFGVVNGDLDFVVDGWAASAALVREYPFEDDGGDEEMVRQCLLGKKIHSNELVRISFLRMFVLLTN